MKTFEKISKNASSSHWDCIWRNGMETGIMQIDSDEAVHLLKNNPHLKEEKSAQKISYKFEPPAILFL